MFEGSRGKKIQRVIVILIALAFIGTSVFGIFAMFGSANQQPGSDLSRAEREEAIQELQVQEENYEVILAREPENQVALQGLVEIRLQTGDFENAIAPMEKLVELNPEVPEYQALLDQLKQTTNVAPENNEEETQIPTSPDN